MLKVAFWCVSFSHSRWPKRQTTYNIPKSQKIVGGEECWRQFPVSFVSPLWIVVVVPGISVSHYLPLQDSCTSSRCTVIIIVMIILEGFFSIHLWCQRAGCSSYHRLIQNVRCISSLLLCCWWGLLGFRKQKQKRGSSNSSRVFQVRILHIHQIKSSESASEISGYYCINIRITYGRVQEPKLRKMLSTFLSRAVH